MRHDFGASSPPSRHELPIAGEATRDGEALLHVPPGLTALARPGPLEVRSGPNRLGMSHPAR